MAVALEAAGVEFYLAGPMDEWTGERPPAGAPVVTRAEVACLRASGKDRGMARAILLVKATFPGARVVRVAVQKRKHRRWYDTEEAKA